MNAEQKSSNSALKTAVEKGSKAFEAKFLQMENEIKNLQESHAESSKNLKIELKKSQELSKNLQDNLLQL